MRSAATELMAENRGVSQPGAEQSLQKPLVPTPPAPAESAETTPTDETADNRLAAKRATLIEFVVFASLLAGAAGIVRATQMERPLDIVVCLVGSVAGCGLVSYLYFRRE